MQVTHNAWLVALSVAIAIEGSYVGLSLALRLRGATGPKRRALLAASAAALAVGIWGMHFVGILAAQLPADIDYLVLPTLLSFLICVLVVGIGLYAATAAGPPALRIAGGSAGMGAGIAAMHYTGMLAVHASAHLKHDPLLVGLSVAIAIGASGLALMLLGGGWSRAPLRASAIVMGLAISGMHYTAMAGTTVYPHPASAPPSAALSPDLLGIVVAIVAFLVSGSFLLSMVPDQATEPQPEPAPETPAEPPIVVAARHAALLPFERDGAQHLLPVTDLLAVRANAHYTELLTHAGACFCPLPISELEGRLDPVRFLRVHRSFIVAVDRIEGIRRTGDAAVVLLATTPPRSVPVARGRLSVVRQRLESQRKLTAA